VREAGNHVDTAASLPCLRLVDRWRMRRAAPRDTLAAPASVSCQPFFDWLED